MAFLPSVTKSLLRYALSKVDLLDTDALNIDDNLNLAFSRQTTLEFRDVGLRAKKFAALLNLPRAISIQRSKVRVLKVTLPLDFYSSPIVIQVDSVEVEVFVPHSTNSRPETPRPSAGSNSEAIVPAAADLAQSFLETQSQAERQELEKALANELDSETEDDSDNESQTGTGQPLSLPTIMTGFLQGIVDRIEIQINRVEFQLNVELPTKIDPTVLEVVSLQLALDSVDVEGVTVPGAAAHGAREFVPKEGKRHIGLHNVRAFLISEAGNFTFSERAPSLLGDAPETPPLGDSEAALGIPYDLSTPPLADDAQSTPRVSQSPDYPFPRMSTPKTPIRENNPGEEFWEGAEDLEASRYEDASSPSPLPAFEAGRAPPSDPLPPDSPESTADFAEAKSVLLSDPQGSPISGAAWASPDITEHLSSSPSEDKSLREAQGETLSVGEPLEAIHSAAEESIPSSPENTPFGVAGGESPSPSDGFEETSSQDREDLTQSRIFTHEEAESMYMSAFSHPRGVGSQYLPMPGGWGSESDAFGNSAALDSGRDTSPAPSPAPMADAASVEPEPKMLLDDMVSTKNPTRLIKEVLSMSHVSVYVPSQREQPSVAAGVEKGGSGGDSHMPGAFSAHLDALIRSPEPGPSGAKSPPSAPASETKTQTNGSLEVVLSPLEVRFDQSLGLILATVVSRLVEATTSGADAPRPTSSRPQTASQSCAPKPAATVSDIEVSISSVSLMFLDRSVGVLSTSTRFLEPDAFQSDRSMTLLQTRLNDLCISRKQLVASTETRLKLGTFEFGYADAPILSFNRDIKMHGSCADLPPTHDVSLCITQLADGSTKIEGHTLPVTLALDLQRIDETMSWFGGLSSFINAGVAREPAAVAAAETPAPPQKARRVSFDVPESSEKGPSTVTNIKIGGADVELIGRECAISLRASTIKLALTDSVIGAYLSDAELTGPHLHSVKTSAPIKVRIQDARVRFFTRPRDSDLERLLRIAIPSDNSFDGGDELMVDPLMRQRKQGSLLRVEVGKVDASVTKAQQLSCLATLSEELAHLGAVAKYFPDDDRPGMLLLANVEKLGLVLDLQDLPPSETLRRLGSVNVEFENVETAHVALPLLAAASVGGVTVTRNGPEKLIETAHPPQETASEEDGPVLIIRMIGDEMEPVVKVRAQDIAFEYRVRVIMELLGLEENATRHEFETHLVASVANLGEQAHAALGHISTTGPGAQSRSRKEEEERKGRHLTLDMRLRNCLLGLNPFNEPSKLVLVLENAHAMVALPDDADVKVDLEIKRSWLMLIDDVDKASLQDQYRSRVRKTRELSRHMGVYSAWGFVNICEMTNAKVLTRIVEAKDGERQVDVRVSDMFVLLETCADSTHTLQRLAGALAPPSPPSSEHRYRTHIVPLQNVLASITEDAFGTAEGDYEFDNDFSMARQLDSGREVGESDEADSGILFVSNYYQADPDPVVGDPLFDAGSVLVEADGNEAVMIPSLPASQSNVSGSDEIDFTSSYYDMAGDGEGPRVWSSTKARYSTAPPELLSRSPLRLAVRDVKLIWNLHDGYDWAHTRDVVGAAIHEAEAAAQERRERREPRNPDLAANNDLVSDCLFNSVYIHVPAGAGGHDLAADINFALNEPVSETASSVPSTVITATTRRTVTGGRRSSGPQKKLKLGRSRNHKIKIELMGIGADMTMLPPGSGETQVTAKIRVHTAEIFDNMPTSTWKKFLTYDRAAGQREYGKQMAKVEVLIVKPHEDLAASELVVRAELLPLRLHVDQDALDFVARFFSFDDADKAGGDASTAGPGQPFLQRVEVTAVPVKLDFKPKRVNYASLRSGKTTELMNFLILDNSNMELRHAIVYGQAGFVRLGETLKSIWMPDITSNQLPSVLSGLSAVRPIVDVGSGFRELIEIPYGEYAKNGRVMRGISKGAYKFAKRTGTELIRLGAKLAVGTQNALEGAEAALGPSSASAARRRPKREMPADDDDDGDGDGDDSAENEYRAPLSLYAGAPTGVVQGIRMGYQSLRRDLNMAKDAAIAIPAEIMESGSASGAVKALLGRSQTVILRPGIAVSKAIGQTLLGATNSIDPDNVARADDKYKHY